MSNYACDYWLTCAACKEEWIGQPYDSQYEEKCPECDSEDFEVGAEYHTPTLHKLKQKLGLVIILLIPNILLFSSN